MMKMTKSILLVGVGGQGTILASKLLTIGLMESGYDVKMSEIHGMSQRGGSVSSQVRYGEKVQSPVIELGSADILVAFEKMEALRWLEYLQADGQIIVNDYQINPMPVLSGRREYSPEILRELEAHASVTVVKAYDEALKLGSAKVLNVILLGATVEKMGLDVIDWDNIIAQNVKPNFADINRRAFKIGRQLIRG